MAREIDHCTNDDAVLSVSFGATAKQIVAADDSYGCYHVAGRRIEAEAAIGQPVTKNIPNYNERFPKGSKARVADRAALAEFMTTWRYHHKLRPEQLEYADRIATVEDVGFYHGGDPVYKLEAYLVCG